jgi:serine/threonine-protein kinase
LLEVVQRARKELGNKNATLSLTVIDQSKTTVIPNADFGDQTAVLESFQLDDNATQVLGALSTTQHHATEVIGSSDSFEVEPTALEKLGSRRRGLNLLITTLLVVLLGAGAGWWFSSGPGGFAAVPDLTSRTVDDAQTALAEINAGVVIVEETSATVTKGLVIRTEPAKGSLFFGGDIKLVVSSGPKLVAVPKLTGKNLAEATTALLSAGFQLGKVDSWFNAAPLGQVFDYLGADGAAIPQGSTVDLQLSLGSIPVVAGIDQAVAIAALEAAGLKVANVSQEFSDTIAGGQVISVMPLTEPIGKDGEVTLVVSKGPNIVIMPRVVGETILAAKSILETMGLRVTVDTNQVQSRWGIAKVKSTTAAEGTQLRFGDNVTIISR